MKVQTLKGFRDFLPNEARKRQYVIDVLRSVFESYGFEPLETPALEYEEILLGKYGEEGDKLMYRFTDLGDRRVALRYDQTVPLARVVAQYGNELAMPFKRYQIQPVWRAENPQRGRFREFLQCDIDTVGVESLLADAEIIACTTTAMQRLGFNSKKTYTRMRINDRSILDRLAGNEITALDKLERRESVVMGLVKRGVNPNRAQWISDYLGKAKRTSSLETLFNNLKDFGLKEDFDYTFDNTLARGLDYYTSIIFELELMIETKREDVGLSVPTRVFSPKLSLGGGGRYDNLIGMFSGKPIPAVGFSFGFDRIIEAMETQNLFPAELVGTKVLVTIFSPELLNKSTEVASTLRTKGINVELYLNETVKLEKQIKYADKKRIPYVLIIGPDEAKSNSATVKTLKTGVQQTVPQEQLEHVLD